MIQSLAVDPGTAELEVSLQIDEGGGFVPLVDLGTVSTGPALSPSDFIMLDGNSPPNVAHFESSVIDAPAPSGAVLRIDFTVPAGDAGAGYIYGLDNVQLQTLLTGDANGDGLFNSADMVQVFQAGEYEDNIPDNSTFTEGDWNGDGDFTSSDMVMAFQTGLYEVATTIHLSDIAAAVDALFARQYTPKSDDAATMLSVNHA